MLPIIGAKTMRKNEKEKNLAPPPQEEEKNYAEEESSAVGVRKKEQEQTLCRQEQLVNVMLREKVCVVSVPVNVARCLLDIHRVCKHRLDTKTIARHFCSSGSHPSLASRDDAIFLFNYLMESNEVSNEMLMGLPTVPLMNGTLGVLSTSVEHLFVQVSQFRNMGFSLKNSTAALVQQKLKKGIDPMEWLMSENTASRSSRDVIGPIFLAKPHDDAVRLLFSSSETSSTTSECLLDITNLSEKTLDRLRTRDVKKYLGHKTMVELSNVMLMEPEHVAMLVPESFPPEWSSLDEIRAWQPRASRSTLPGVSIKGNKSRNKSMEESICHPSKIFMYTLWEYLLTMPAQTIATHFEQKVFLPTAQGTLSRLRASMPVLLEWPDQKEEDAVDQSEAVATEEERGGGNEAESTKEPTIRSVLKVLGVQTVDRSMVAKGTIKILSPLFLERPSRSGVLSALSERAKNDPTKFLDMFDLLDDVTLSIFKLWIEREDPRTLTKKDINVLRLLPLYQTVAGATSIDAMEHAGTGQHKYVRNLTRMLLDVAGEENDKDVDENTVRSVVPSDCILTKSSSEERLLEALGVRGVTFSTFLIDDFLPAITTHGKRTMKARDMVIRSMLANFSELSREEERLEEVLRKANFVPSGTEGLTLMRCEDLYDTENQEIVNVLNDTHLPSASMRDPTTLSMLRRLGLRRNLTRTTVCEIIHGVENERNEDRADLLLRYMDANSGRLFSVDERKRKRASKKSNGFFASIGRTLTGEPTTEEKEIEAEEQDIIKLLQVVQTSKWVPTSSMESVEVVRDDFPWLRTNIPATEKTKQKDTGRTGDTYRSTRLMLPSRTRPLSDVWSCSCHFGMVSTPVLSLTLRTHLGWTSPIPPDALAKQLVALGSYHASLQQLLLLNEKESEERDYQKNQAKKVHDEEKEEKKERKEKKEKKNMTSDRGSGEQPAVSEMLKMFGVRLPQMYEELDKSMSSSVAASLLDSVRSTLVGQKWIWIETGAFVESERLSSEVERIDCRPFLYVVPSHLRRLSSTFQQNLVTRFGVRTKFGPVDYTQVLKDLYVESVQTSKGGGERGGGERNRSLVGRRLDLAISVVQILSDYDRNDVERLEIYAPDESCVLRPTTSLQYNDVPWLQRSNAGEVGSSGSSSGSGDLFIHPKLSNAVAAKLGVMSLRMSLIDSNIVDLSTDLNARSASSSVGLGSDEGQAFGQGEPLTRRLKGIIELYPEGTQVLAELLQNADDAGATEFCLLLNKKSYGKASLLSGTMAPMQGPSLYCHNNAIFQPHDFENLARIGQGSKLDKLQTTGRFGLGFNSVYHYTSMPSFVSGDHIVFFDPHTSFVPRATTQKPGLKLEFTKKTTSGTSLRERFRDQFEPYEIFGNNMKERYNGTLFRLPLRTHDNSSNDEIKRTTCSVRRFFFIFLFFLFFLFLLIMFQIFTMIYSLVKYIVSNILTLFGKIILFTLFRWTRLKNY